MVVSQSNRGGHPPRVVEPPLSEWASIAAENRRLLSASPVSVAGQPLHRLRAQGRRDTMELARLFSQRAGLTPSLPPHLEADGPLAITGHQPILCSTGVWSKYFALSRFAEGTSGVGIDLVIDSDRAAPIAADVPSLDERPSIQSIVLSPGHADKCFAATPVPSRTQVASFAEGVLSALHKLPPSAAINNFEAFSSALITSLPQAQNGAELMAFTRRHFEAPAGLHYLQVPVTKLATTLSFRFFAADILLRAVDFAAAYNQELAVFRTNHKVRSAAQPVPDLRCNETGVEIPFWILTHGARRRAFVRPIRGAIEVFSQEGEAYVIPDSVDELVSAFAGLRLAPKALALTMYARLFLADIFIHGTGGARYDSVTDGIIRRFYGLDAPHFAVISIPEEPPYFVSDSGLSKMMSIAKDRLKALKHHPENALEAGLQQPNHPHQVEHMDLVSQKRRLIAEMSKPGADKAILGGQMRHINELLRASLQAEVSVVEAELADLLSMEAQVSVLGDRRYPYCFFDPREYSQIFTGTVL